MTVGAGKYPSEITSPPENFDALPIIGPPRPHDSQPPLLDPGIVLPIMAMPDDPQVEQAGAEPQVEQVGPELQVLQVPQVLQGLWQVAQPGCNAESKGRPASW